MNFNLENYEEYALDYLEGNLGPDERDAFQTFLLLHPDVQRELEGFDFIRVEPDLSEGFAGKDQLYRRKPIIPRYLIGLGAILILLIICFGPNLMDLNQSEPGMVFNEIQSVQVPEKSLKLDEDETAAMAKQSTQQGEIKRVVLENISEEVDGKQDLTETPKISPPSASPAAAPVSAVSSEEETEQTVLSEPVSPQKISREKGPFLLKLELIEPRLIPNQRHLKIEVIHESLLEQYSRILDESAGKGKFGQWITQANLVPKAFKEEKNTSWKERLLPDYIVAE